MFTIHVCLPIHSHLGKAASYLQHVTSLAVVEGIKTMPGYQVCLMLFFKGVGSLTTKIGPISDLDNICCVNSWSCHVTKSGVSKTYTHNCCHGNGFLNCGK